MKKVACISLAIFMAASLLSYSQTKNSTTGSYAFGNSKPGLMNITELNFGIGLYRLERDFSKRIFNLTSICSIGLARNFSGGIGVGVSLYDGGTLVPLFADFRYFTKIRKARIFIFGDGGILLNSANTTNGFKFLVSPGAGVIFPVGNNLSLSLGAGIVTQLMKGFDHDSFAIIKPGMIYLFNPPSRKASAFGRRSRPTADEDGGREG